jgi:ABC-2 type transport system permease protein
MTTATINAQALRVARRSKTVSAVPTLTMRRLALTVRSPRSIAVPLLAPVLFALVVAPALSNTVAAPGQRTASLTFFALATAGLLIPLNCMFSGLGVVVDREQGAMRELLVAPIRRTDIVLGNLLAAMAVTALQLVVLIAAAAARGAAFKTSRHLVWFLAAAALFCVVIYGLAEILATKLTSPEEYTAALPAVSIVPFFFSGSLYPITALPHWLEYVARVLPLTHVLALFRYGLTSDDGSALHSIWGMSNVTTMAALSLGVIALYAAVIMSVAIRVFTKAGRN